MDDVVRYPNLLKRGDVFSFRAKVPTDLVEAFGGKRQIWESLKTGDPAEAKRSAVSGIGPMRSNVSASAFANGLQGRALAQSS